MKAADETIFSAASQLRDPAKRALYLDWACGNDPERRQRIEDLLQAEQELDGFLDPDPSELKFFPVNEAPGSMVGPYKLLQKIGEGGCGIVYMAEQEKPIRRRVALKVIKLGMDTRQVIARFEIERQALAMMDHPNIAKVLDAGATESGRPYFVMELVRGVRITDYCDENHLSTRERLELFMKAAHAVQHAHQKGIIHRDIKPSNILVTLHDGVPVPKVIDFGIAKATEQKLTDKTVFTAFEQFIGTPAYVSPEQAEMSGLDIDTRADIYSLGVLLYEVLVGKTPFDTRELQQSGLDDMRRIIREREPARPSTRLSTMLDGELTTTAQSRRSSPPELIHSMKGDLDWIVMKCIEKDRTRRYETANELILDIQRHLNNEPVLARAPSNLYRFGKLIRRNKLLFTAAGAVVTALAVGALVSFSQWRRAEEHAVEERLHRQQAEHATAQAQAALTQMEAVHLGRAEELVQARDRSRALPYWALILRHDPTHPLATWRLLSALTQRPWSVLACPPLVHSNPVTSALFSRSGTRIVTAASDQTAAVWDSATGARVCGPLRHDDSIEYAELSPDDTLVITASRDHTVRFWNAITGVPLIQPLRFEGEVPLAKISPTSSHFVAVERRTRIHVGKFPPQANQQLLHFEADADDGEFSPDGRFFAGNSFTGIVTVVDVVAGKIAAQLPHPGRVRGLTFHPNGRQVVTACYDGGVRLWDIRTRTVIATLPHSDAVLTAEVSKDGNYLATGDSIGVARLWDLGTRKIVGGPMRHWGAVRSVSFSSDGSQLITSAWDHTARIWDPFTGRPVSEPIAQSYPLFWAQFDASGQRILTAGRGDVVAVWSVPKPSGQSFRNLSRVQAAEFSPDGRSILLTSSRGVEEFDAQQVKPLRVFATNEPPSGLPARYVKGGSLVALFLPPNKMELLDVRTKELQRQIPTVLNLSHFDLTADGRWLVTQSDEGIEVFDLAADGTDAKSIPLPHKGTVRTVLLSPDNQRLLTVSADGVGRIWELANLSQPPRVLQTDDPIQLAAYSPDGLQVATTTDAKRRLRFWDGRSGKATSEEIRLAFKPFQCLFSPDGRRLAVRVGDPVYLFDPIAGKYVAGPIAHSGLEGDSRVAFSPDSRMLVTSGRTNLHFWSSETGLRIGDSIEIDSISHIVHFHPKSQRLLCVTSNGTLSVRNVLLKPFAAPAWLPALADALAASKFGDDGRTVSLSAIDLWKAQQQMLADTSGNPASKWAHWFLSGADNPD